jgi:hypothetical protein
VLLDTAYAYDNASRLSAQVEGGVTTTFTYEDAGQLINDTSHSYSFDAAGNRNMTGYQMERACDVAILIVKACRDIVVGVDDADLPAGSHTIRRCGPIRLLFLPFQSWIISRKAISKASGPSSCSPTGKSFNCSTNSAVPPDRALNRSFRCERFLTLYIWGFGSRLRRAYSAPARSS